MQRGLLVLLCILASACDFPDKPATSPEPSTPQTSLLPQRTGPPNVILITLDTTRADALGVYGQKRPTSPHLDALARAGVRFQHADTSAPITLPSHASIMTAVHPFTHGVRANAGYELPDALITLAERFSENGYQTGAEIASHVLNRNTGIHQGFEEFHDLNSKGITKKRSASIEGGAKAIALDERDAKDITTFGISFVERHRDKPFFLWLHYFDPHNFYTPPAKYLAQFPDSPYHGEIRFTDDQIGKLLETLDQLDLRKDTLIVVTADHGEGLGDHHEDTHAMFLYDSTTRVPLILSGADIGVAGSVVETFVRTIDIAPTILDAVDLPPLEGVQGVSLLPLLQETAPFPASNARPEIAQGYSETLATHLLFGTPILRYLRDGEWKYMHKPKPELYDLRADPQERDNLAEKHPEKVEDLRSQLTELIASSAGSVATTNKSAVDSETLQRLQQLGYVSASPGLEFTSELQTLELTGPDPNDLLPEIQQALKFSGYLHANYNLEEAAQGFRELSQRFPNSQPILRNYIRILVKLGRSLEALNTSDQLVRTKPVFIEDLYGLADIALSINQPDRAMEALEQAAEIDPCSERATLQLSSLHYSMQRQEQSIAVLERGAAACPDNWRMRNNLAYILSTSPNPDLRDGPKAVVLAQEAARLTMNQRASVLDSLAAAYAEAGQFDQAIHTAKNALALIQQQTSDPRAIESYRTHLALYESGTPLREE